eukprot:gnl/Spiro4/6109_TR3137_c0_g1_i1.p1 gnl/Spiro4/6109_TR3137_c0_g1~~gnl/Spiro4/6109_TR3137_c0_g1_i1.p1  ORF type:complete len:466 (+),score=172.52 gnl/Spiro4/6109_TR3137_c0_g1_i1:32-1399(+)
MLSVARTVTRHFFVSVRHLKMSKMKPPRKKFKLLNSRTEFAANHNSNSFIDLLGGWHASSDSSNAPQSSAPQPPNPFELEHGLPGSNVLLEHGDLRALSVMKSLPANRIYTALLQGMFESGLWENGLDLLKRLVAGKRVPAIDVFNQIIGVLGRARRLDDVLEVLRTMKAAAVAPDLHTYQSLFANMKMEVLHDLAGANLQPSAEMLAELRNSYNLAGDYESAELLAHFSLSQISSTHTNALLVADKLTRIIEEVGNAKALSELVVVDAERGHPVKGLAHLNQMLAAGLTPSIEAFNSLIEYFSTRGLPDNAIDLFKKLMDLNIVPTSKTMNLIIDMLGKAGEIDKQLEVYRRLTELGVPSDNATFNSLIHELGRNGRHADSLRLYRNMLAAGLQPDLYTFDSLVDGAVSRKLPELARMYYDQMRARGIESPKLKKIVRDAEAKSPLRKIGCVDA